MSIKVKKCRHPKKKIVHIWDARETYTTHKWCSRCGAFNENHRGWISPELALKRQAKKRKDV